MEPLQAPPHLLDAEAQLLSAIESVDKKRLDPLTCSWRELEQSLIRLLGGPYQPGQPEHQMLALGVAMMLARRLMRELSAFWFVNRDSPEGVMLGFPEALMTLSPFGAVVDALGHARLERLDDVIKELRTALAQVKFSGAAPSIKLNPLDYQRLFDPGFVHFIAVDASKMNELFESTPQKLVREIRDALGRVNLPVEAKKQFEAQIVGALQRLEERPLKELVERAPRIAELMVHLFATSEMTSVISEEFWQDVAFPLVHVGAPESFPPLDEEERGAVAEGVDPLLLLLDTVPYQFPAREEGLFGVFGADELALPHQSFAKASALRLVRVSLARLSPAFEAFDAGKLRATLERFKEYLKAQVPAPAAQAQLLPPDVFEAALTTLAELKALVASKRDILMRRVTEGEASSEAVVKVLRDALKGPRLILVS